MDWQIENFLASHPYSPETVKKYVKFLGELIQLDDLETLSAPDLVNFINRPTWGNSQRSVALYACRKYLAWRYGASHPALSARIKRVRPKRQPVLTADQALALLASFDPSTRKGTRDLAIAALALDTGLRVSELCRIRLADVDLEHHTLQVIVKGGQWEIAVFSAQTARYIELWLACREAQPGVGTLFVSVTLGKPLTREGLQTIVKTWGQRIGIKLSPHMLRRSFATLTTIYGAPSRVVQVAGRWSSMEMVERYTRDLQASEIEPYLPVSRLTK